jgi:hypothetical protein
MRQMQAHLSTQAEPNFIDEHRAHRLSVAVAHRLNIYVITLILLYFVDTCIAKNEGEFDIVLRCSQISPTN